jgi:Family of unknown function (DUF5677)
MKRTTKLRKLLGQYVSFVDGQGWYPRKLYLDHILLALMSKSVTTAQSVLCLIDNGYYAEAFASTRTLADIFYSVRFIANKDSEERARRFEQYYGKDREQWMKIIGDYFPETNYKTSPDHARLMRVAKKFDKDPHRWSGKSIREMVAEPDSFETDSVGNPVNWLPNYQMFYRWTSQYVHSTIVALRDHTVDDTGAFKIHSGRKDETKCEAMAVFLCCLYVGMTFRDALRAMNDHFPDNLSEDTSKLLEELAKQPN